MTGADARELPLSGASANGRVVIESDRALSDVKIIADWALARGLDLPDLDVRRPSLEDVYLQLTRGPE